MKMNRRNFLKRLSLAGGSLLLGLSGGLLTRCTIQPEDVEDRESPSSDQLTDFPGYGALQDKGKLTERIDQAYALLENCSLCPRKCGVNRIRGETGFCRTGEKAVVFAGVPHFGEEHPLVGREGSGTIFFSNCNLRCVFCQNYPVAHEGRGQEISADELADLMIDLQRRGCPNINLVTPTHVMPQILQALGIAQERGLDIPLCYNTSGYEERQVIKILDGIVDIYLPDLKFMDGTQMERFSIGEAKDYPKKAKEAISEMHTQVGDLHTSPSGIARRGVMLRHLVMPNRVSGTQKFVKWVAKNLSTDTYVNIMAQYRVEYLAYDFEEISRAITPEEFIEAMEWAEEAGLTNLDARSLQNLERFRRRLG